MKTEKHLMIGQLSEHEKKDFQKFFDRMLPSFRKAWPGKIFIEPQEALKGLDKTPDKEHRQYLWYVQSILETVDLQDEYRKAFAEIVGYDYAKLGKKDVRDFGQPVHIYLQAAEKAFNATKN
jgi:hypothetical protein